VNVCLWFHKRQLQKINPFEVQYRKCHISNWRYQISNIILFWHKCVKNYRKLPLVLSLNLYKMPPNSDCYVWFFSIPFKHFLDQIFFHLITNFSVTHCVCEYLYLKIYFCNCTPTDSRRWNKLKVMSNLKCLSSVS
jgi:hypothetical protein